MLQNHRKWNMLVETVSTLLEMKPRILTIKN